MDGSLYDEYKGLELPKLLEQVSAASTGSTSGTDKIHVLRNFVLVRTTEMVTKQLAETARVTNTSATLLKGTLEKATGDLLAASAQNAASTEQSANRIRNTIVDLTSALQNASTDFQNAGKQSAELGRRLNWLTGFLVAAALISALATAFQAFETKRQADMGELQRVQHRPAPASAATPAAPTQR
jgi:hypothetical protein